MNLLNPLQSENEKLTCASKSIPYPECLYLSKSAFLVSFTAPKKEFPNVKSTLCLNSPKFTPKTL